MTNAAAATGTNGGIGLCMFEATKQVTNYDHRALIRISILLHARTGKTLGGLGCETGGELSIAQEVLDVVDDAIRPRWVVQRCYCQDTRGHI